MLLLTRPPYLRWLAAAALVVAAIGWDLSARATAPFPFAAEPIPPGTAITEDLVEWRDLPVGTFPLPELASALWAAHRIDAGDPIVPSLTTGSAAIPEGWWAVPMRIPPGLARGAAVRLLLPTGSTVPGVVAVPASDDVFSGPTGAVAVAEGDLRTVATAAVGDLVTVLVEP